MNIKKLCAVYSLLVGISIALVWIIYFATGAVMGVKPEAAGLSFHIAAEFAAAAAMIAAGIGLLANRGWARDIYFLSMGLLFYALINSPGYYISGGGRLIIAVFAGSFLLALVFTALGIVYLKDNNNSIK